MLFGDLVVLIHETYGTESFMVRDIVQWYSNYSHAQGDVYRLWRMGLLKRSTPPKKSGYGKGKCYWLSSKGEKYVEWATRPETYEEFVIRLAREKYEFKKFINRNR